MMTLRTSKLLPLLGLIALSPACGQKSYLDSIDKGAAINAAPPVNASQLKLPSPGQTQPSNFPIATNPASSPAPAPAIKGVSRYFPVIISGSGSYTSPSVETTNLLRATVRVGAPMPLAGTSGRAGYNCQRLTVTALNQSRTVFVKKSGYFDRYESYFGFDPCAGAQESVTVDFSPGLGLGYNSVNVKVSDAVYDNCRLANDSYEGGCAMSSVHPSHQVRAEIEIEVNRGN